MPTWIGISGETRKSASRGAEAPIEGGFRGLRSVFSLMHFHSVTNVFFIRYQQWINDAIILPTTAASTSQTEKATISAERLAQLRQKWVKVPQDSKKAASVCPVCKEAFKAEWSDSEEEWIWKNALAINGVVCHFPNILNAGLKFNSVLSCNLSSGANICFETSQSCRT